jgi:hypothetical protein
VRDTSLRARDFKPGELPAGAQGPQGDPGPTGSQGPQGERGPSDAYSSKQPPDEDAPGPVTRTLNVPAGDYAVSAGATAQNIDSVDPVIAPDPALAFCQTESAGDPAGTNYTVATVAGVGFTNSAPEARGGMTSLAVNTTFHLTAPGTITVTCSDSPRSGGPPLRFAAVHVQAVRLGELHR